MPPRTIAIDGPAGSGKSVVGLWLARTLGYAYLDTGVLYRAVAWLARHHAVAASDGPTLADLVSRSRIDVQPPATVDDARGYRVFIDDQDVTEELFSAGINELVSRVAAQPEVRTSMLPVQRQVASGGGIVMAGRDIGTVVLPEADLKLYLDASIGERARRRWQQEDGRRSLDAVLEDVRRRDRADSGRTTAPLKPADDAVVLLTDGMSLDEEKRRILEIVSRSAPQA